MKRLLGVGLVVALYLVLGNWAIGAAAEDQGVNGTWKFTVSFGGQDREQTIKLKQEGDKLTGALVGRDGQDTAIEDGKVKGNEISFKVTVERNGNKRTSKYTGKLEGTTLQLTIERERNGEVQKSEVKATRAAK
jgi:hypothetical protein